MSAGAGIASRGTAVAAGDSSVPDVALPNAVVAHVSFGFGDGRKKAMLKGGVAGEKRTFEVMMAALSRFDECERSLYEQAQQTR
jgi:hypothetical protein